MCCFGRVSIGGLPQSFWAVWDRQEGRLHERTRFSGRGVRLDPGRVRVRDRGVAIDLSFDEHDGVPIEVSTGEIWTRKRAGLEFTGSVVVGGRERTLIARGIIDDSAGAHERHTVWSWSAGVGALEDGAPVAWNLVDGIHDGPTGSERAVWIDGVPYEPPPVSIDVGLTHVRSGDGALALECAHEATRRRDDNMLLVRSRYAQPFGVFTGTLPGGRRLAEGFGVMEHHDVHW